MRWEALAALVLVSAALTGCVGSQGPEIEPQSRDATPNASTTNATDGSADGTNASQPSVNETSQQAEDAIENATVADDRQPRDVQPRPQAVVSLLDTGINPYHQAFRWDDPRAESHPSTYIPGYPEDAQRLDLSLDADNWSAAVRADCPDVWSEIETRQLYWIPGTKIVGAITFEGDPLDCSEDPEEASASRILDISGHGTMTASRAAGNTYGACPDCYIVSIETLGEEAVTWAGEQASWIDLQSNSWAPILPGWAPEGDIVAYDLVNDPSFVRAVEQAARKHLALWASGNGAANRLGAVGHPTLLDPHFTPSVVIVGGHDSGYVATWPSFPPHVVSDACDSWAAYHDSMDESDATVGSGTSGAAPYVAGKAAGMLLHARRMLDHTDTGLADGVAASGTAAVDPSQGPLTDGVLNRTEWRSLVLKTAQQRPQREHADGPRCGIVEGLVLYGSTPVKWEDVPESYPAYLHIGYGAVNNASTERALHVLEGTEPLPQRPDASAYFAVDRTARETTYPVWTAQAPGR